MTSHEAHPQDTRLVSLARASITRPFARLPSANKSIVPFYPLHQCANLTNIIRLNMVGPFRPASPAEDLPSYYHELGDENIQHCFRDFDNERNFDLFDRQTRNPRSNNFCLDFGEQDAFCAFDLDAQSFAKLLNAPRPQELHTRWINIWMPYNQKDLLRVVGQHFDFTPRLLGMMMSDPCPPRLQSRSIRKKKSESTLRSRFSGKSSRSATEKQVHQTGRDSEESIGMTELMHSTQLEMVQDLSHYQLVNDVWHWSTVDWGRRCKLLRFEGIKLR